MTDADAFILLGALGLWALAGLVYELALLVEDAAEWWADRSPPGRR